MKRKGFTLVELMAVIVILGLLATIIYPIVSRSINDSANDLYEVQKKNIEEAARTWGADHIGMLPADEGKQITVTLGELQDGGYIDDKLTNPKSKKELGPTVVVVRITYTKGILQYAVEGY